MAYVQRDLLRECNDKQAPLDEFQTGFCARCVNPECGRSLYGQSKFDVRVNTWEERLFQNVPRMDAQDPRYAPLANKRFLTVDQGRTPEIRSNWFDPREAQEPPAQAPLSPEARAPEALSTQPAFLAPAQPPRTPARVPAHLLLSNTSTPAGIMIGQPPAASPPRDPWAAPEPSKDLVVPVGSRVKMNGSGV